MKTELVLTDNPARAARVSISQRDDGVLAVSGEVCFSNAVALREQGEKLIDRAAEHFVVDLGELRSVQGVSLSVFLCWLRHSGSQGKQLEYRNVPPEVKAIARVSAVEKILGEAFAI